LAIGSSFRHLPEQNLDHFGVEARPTHNAGYAAALALAAEGELSIALAINGFADNFLQDYFAAGHIMVPRREIAEIAAPSMFPISGFSKITNGSSNVSKCFQSSISNGVTKYLTFST
jgi:Flp pilus assembly protein TadG